MGLGLRFRTGVRLGLGIDDGGQVVGHLRFSGRLWLAPRVGGIIVEEGALLQHATTLAREFGVPAIVALRRATELFATGDLLEVNGFTGEVIRREPAP